MEAKVVARVLIVDDDDGLRHRLVAFLNQNAIDATEAASGEQGLEALRERAFDAVLLDVVMPGLDGIDVMKRIREASAIPILLLTARDSETDRVVGLELGADDYIVKPFRSRELLARIRSVLRRAGVLGQHNALVASNVEVLLTTRTVLVSGQPVEFSGIEFDLLVALIRSRGRVLARESLLAEAGRTDVVVSERTVDVHLSRIRKKLGDDSKTPRLIKTVHGVGYVFAG